MFRLITLLIALVAGFSGGMWYGVHHPEDAAKLSEYEQAKLLEFKIQATEAVKAQLDKKIADTKAKPVGGLGFLGGAAKPSADQALTEVSNEQDQEIAKMKQQLSQMKK